MKSVGTVILAIFAILLFASTTTESRNVPGGEYWREVMKDEAMPKAIKSLIISHKTKLSHAFTDKFEPSPNVTVYPKDDRIDFSDEFEPVPNVTAYPENDRSTFTDDFEPVPNVTAYPEDPRVINGHAKEYNSFSQEFEPSPDISVYNE